MTVLRSWAVRLLLMAAVLTISVASAADQPYLSIALSCRDNPGCVYTGAEITIDIVLTNITVRNIKGK